VFGNELFIPSQQHHQKKKEKEGKRRKKKENKGLKSIKYMFDRTAS
jgi:hypothetical protein